MNTVYQGYFDRAELALAAYADFSLAPRDGSGVLDRDKVKEALIKLKGFPLFKKEADFSSTEASLECPDGEQCRPCPNHAIEIRTMKSACSRRSTVGKGGNRITPGAA